MRSNDPNQAGDQLPATATALDPSERVPMPSVNKDTSSDHRETPNEELWKIVWSADESTPASPHRHFVMHLVRAVYAATGRVHAEAWYRRLVIAAGCSRRPSTRTVNACVLKIKDEVGQARGPTQSAVLELRRQYASLLQAVDRIENLVAQVSKVAQRQAAISEAIDRRQMMFTDQSAVYQRQIDQLAGIVRENATASREVTKAANDVALSAARALRDVNHLLQKLPPSGD